MKNLIIKYSLLLGMLMPMFAVFAQTDFSQYAVSADVPFREMPQSKAMVVGRLMMGEEVYHDGSVYGQSQIEWNGAVLNGKWKKIRTQSGQQGWVHSALLSTQPTMPNYKVRVDQLRVRQEPHLKGKILNKLKESSTVSFTGNRSAVKEMIELRGQYQPYYWLEVLTANGDRGWVYGGGLRLVEEHASFLPEDDPVSLLSTDQPASVSSSEKMMLQNWWNDLSNNWKAYFNEVLLGKEAEEFFFQPSFSELQFIYQSKKLDISFNDDCQTGPFYSMPLWDLSGISALPNLEELNCDYLSIDQLDILTSLPELKRLSLKNSKLKSLKGLEKLKKLEWLDLSLENAAFLDFSGLKKLPQLKVLFLSLDKMKDFKNLNALVNLEQLYLNCPDIRSLTGISGLFKLKQLSIEAEQSELDLRPLNSLVKMKYLNVRADAILHPEAMLNFSELTVLALNAEEMDFNAKVLEKMTQLKELEINASRIFNPEAFSYIRQLKVAYIKCDHVFDVKHIRQATNLRILELQTPEIHSLTELSSFGELRKLSLLSGNLESIEELPEFLNLSQLEIESDKLLSLKGIGRFNKLLSLNISGCSALFDLEPLRELPLLEQLYVPSALSIDGLKIRDISRAGLEIRYRPISGC